MDGYPCKYTSFMTRLARWIRGDWQIIKWLKSKKLNLLSKYKIFDNLRRSLFEISIIIGIVYFLILQNILKINQRGKIYFLCFIAIWSIILEIVNQIIFKKDGEQKQKDFTPKIGGYRGKIYRAILTLGCIPYKAYVHLKSIAISVYRMVVTKKHLLEWTTSEEAEKISKTDLFSYYKIMFINVVLAGLLLTQKFYILGILWIITPFLMYYISIEKEKKYPIETLNNEEKDYVLEIGKRTWEYFGDNVTKENNYLVPDNFQIERKPEYVDRTSSTNIGLSLLAVISGIDLNYIKKQDGLTLICNIVDTIDSLEKWNGHLYNWYNIKTKVPLIPRYISTVDSGNFVGYLYVLVEYLKEQEKNENIEMLIKRVENLIKNTDFSKLYSKEHRLFSIGFNIEENRLTDSYYDLLASEARQASLVAIAKKDVPAKHWNSLNRTLTVLNRKKGLISWSGTAFEYLMPNINIPRYEGSLLDESIKFAEMSQIEYSKKLGLPWGISESAFSVKDLHSNYQYKAFGIPWLGLKRGLADEMVIASYASILAINDKPKEVIQNLKALTQYGMYDKYGFFESLDATPSRMTKGKKTEVVSTYMAHHQALILLSINNLINKNIFQKRFVKNPEIASVSILLQERMPETYVVTKEEKEKPEKLVYQDYENYAEVSYKNTDEKIIRGNVISNEKYTIAINQRGIGVSKYGDIYINRFKKTDDYSQGIFFYIKNIKSKRVWNTVDEKTIVTFSPNQNKFVRTEENIKSTLKITVDAEKAVEIRNLKLENMGLKEETLEITSYFEPVLSKKEQDYAHPAFNNLFLMFNFNEEEKCLEVKRKARGESEKEIILLAKLFTESKALVDNEFEIDKEKLNERGNLGIPKAIVNSKPFSKKIGLVTEPIVAMKKTIKISPGENVNISLIISVDEDKNQAVENLKLYENEETINRAFELSRAKIDAESRYLGIKGKDILLYQKVMSYIIFDNPIKKKQLEQLSGRYKQSDLWKYGISGDLPIILVTLQDANDSYVIKQVLKMYEFFMTKNFLVDIVILDEEKHSYENYVREEIENKILDSHFAYRKNINGGIFVISKNEVKLEDINLIKFVASIVIDSHKGDLEHAISDSEEEYLSRYEKLAEDLGNVTTIINEPEDSIDILQNPENLKYYNEYGAFSADGKEYLIRGSKQNRIPTVWSNILANEKFGTVVTENMGGYTWYRNCRLNRVSSWSNKAFLDIPSEVIYIKDETTKKAWSLGLNPMPDDNIYNVIYGFGYARYIHESMGIMQELDVFVPNEDSVKVNILRLNNKTLERKKLKILYYVKPVLGEDEIKSNEYIKVEFLENANILLASNLYENEFNSKIYLGTSEKITSYTGDKKFFLGKGGLNNPDAIKKLVLNNDNGLGKSACMAIQIEVELESFSSKEIVLTLGAEENAIDCKNMAYKYSKISNCVQELDNVKRKWKDLLEKVQVYTPIESINIMLNGWSVYQTMTSRLLGKTGFYQSGGAYGFRDQLQDTLGLKFISPEIMKNQIIKHSKHQFIEGDVEHWWHEETGRGIRTRFSDDLLWLVFLVEEYIEMTGDKSVLDIETSFLAGEVLKENEDERYDLYKSSDIQMPIYNHCIKAIEKSLNFGERNLPKIGTGDWNDGFSTVGNKGKGESVWLGFFLYLVLEKFIPICIEKNDTYLADKYKEVMQNLKKALNTNAWDGRWFKRAYTDDGDILGSIENEECRIDSIAQSWSVISGAGDNDKKFISMESLENHLVDKEHAIIKLLDPPFENGKLKPRIYKIIFTRS